MLSWESMKILEFDLKSWQVYTVVTPGIFSRIDTKDQTCRNTCIESAQWFLGNIVQP